MRIFFVCFGFFVLDQTKKNRHSKEQRPKSLNEYVALTNAKVM